MRHDEWLKLRKIEVLDRLGTVWQLIIFGLGILGCVFVTPIFYIPILIGCIVYSAIIYHSISIMIYDIQTELWNDRFEETMNKMITLRR